MPSAKQTGFKAFTDFIVPSREGLALYTLLGAILILIAKVSNIFSNFTAKPGISEDIKQFGSSLIDSTDKFSNFSGVLIWFIVGAIIYLLIWAMAVVIIDGYNDAVVSLSFVHPKSFHQSDYWVAIAGRFLLRAAASCLLIALLLLSIGKFIPTGYNVGLSGWSQDRGMAMARSFIGILLGAALVLHIATLLLRLACLRRRLYG